MKPEEDPAYKKLIDSLPSELKQNVNQLVNIWYKNGYNDGYAEAIKAGKER